MERERKMDDKSLLNKKVTIYYNDTNSSVSKLIGKILIEDETFIALEVNDLLRWLPKRVIVRIEEINEVAEDVSNKKD